MPEQEGRTVIFGKVSIAKIAVVKYHTSLMISNERVSWSVCCEVVATLIVLEVVKDLSKRLKPSPNSSFR
jgi:hypothetical protein